MFPGQAVDVCMCVCERAKYAFAFLAECTLRKCTQPEQCFLGHVPREASAALPVFLPVSIGLFATG